MQARLVVDGQRARTSEPRSPDPMSPTGCRRTIAIVAEVPRDRLLHAIPAFPTRSEIWLALLADWDF